MPALRLPGPLNATPAQRAAALAGRVCTDAELADELRRVTDGASRVDEWSDDAQNIDSHVLLGPVAGPDERSLEPRLHSPAPPQRRWFHVVSASACGER